MNQKNKKSPDAYISVGIIFLLRDKKDSPRPHDAGKSNLKKNKIMKNTKQIFSIYKANKGKKKTRVLACLLYFILLSKVQRN